MYSTTIAKVPLQGQGVITTRAKQPSLLNALVHLWKLLKGRVEIMSFYIICVCVAAKVTLPCDQLLSYQSFQLYLTSQTSMANIWSSLSETLLTLLYHNILTSPVIEALWLCRIEELSDDPTSKACVRILSIIMSAKMQPSCKKRCGFVKH